MAGRPAHLHQPGVRIDARDLVEEQARAGEARQPGEVDMDVVEAVMAGDEAGQHARIGRVHVGRDQGQPDPGQRPHAEAPQHGDMAVAAADQHDVLDDGDGRFYRTSPLRWASRERSSTSTVSPASVRWPTTIWGRMPSAR